MPRITAVVANLVQDTGAVDETFLYYTSADAFGQPWGTIRRHDVWGGRAQARLSLFTPGVVAGPIYMASRPFTIDPSAVQQLLEEAAQRYDHMVLLLDVVIADLVERACLGLHYEFIVHRVNKELSTSQNRV